jgi:hypothetical protein
VTAPDRTAVEAAARIRAWRQQLDGNQRAWFRRNGHPMPDPLNDPDEEVPCRLGCGTDLVADDGTKLPLLLADLDAVVDEVAGQERDEAPQLPDPRGPEHQKVVTDWHAIAAEGFRSQTPDGDEWFVEYDVDHPAECDRLPYGEQCLVNRALALFGDDGQLGTATRRARAHVYGPDMNGDFEEWIEWGGDVDDA